MRRTKRSRTRHLVTLGALSASALAPSVTRADSPTFGAGMFLNFTSGGREGLEFGFEAFSMHRFAHTSCESNGNRAGVGALAQVGFLGGVPRLTFAAHGGSEVQRELLALAGELGLTYRFASEDRIGLHVGLVPELSFFNLAFRYQALLDEVSWGAGVRFMPTFGAPESLCDGLGGSRSVPGRPLRGDHGIEPAGDALREDELPAADGGGGAEVGAAWERDAQLEAASIPAFMQLACELAWHGAPSVLVSRALEAIRDEAFHADACAKLASAHFGRRLTPVLPDAAPRPILRGRAGLVRLAVESWVDGCLGEGRAARQAAAAAERAGEGIARATQQRIAEAEARHAELAWDVLLWTLVAGGDEVREALRACRTVAIARSNDADAPAGRERFARLGATDANSVAEAHARRARARLDRILG